MAAKCDTCHGTGECPTCDGTGKINQNGEGGSEHQCPSCADPGNGICRVCLGSGEEPEVEY